MSRGRRRQGKGESAELQQTHPDDWETGGEGEADPVACSGSPADCAPLPSHSLPSPGLSFPIIALGCANWSMGRSCLGHCVKDSERRSGLSGKGCCD